MSKEQPRVENFMNKDIATVFPWDTIEKAYDLLLDKNLRALLVIDEEEKLVGIVSERDIVRYRTRNILPRHAEYYINVSDLMTTNLNTFDPAATLCEACDKFVETGNNQIPVVNPDNSVAGIVAQQDLLKYFSENFDRLLGINMNWERDYD